MTHQEAVSTLASERYLLGEMTELERHAFEDHFFDCAECTEDVRAGAYLREGARAGFTGTSAKTSSSVVAFPDKTSARPLSTFIRRGVVYCTIVKDMRWTSGQPDRARIEGNPVIVDNLGTFYIGEILITDQSRRLTMFRAVLGSPDGGEGGGVDIDMNGGWAP